MEKDKVKNEKEEIDWKEIKEFLQDYDLELEYCPVLEKDWELKEIWFHVRTLEDQSVGIFGVQISPDFREGEERRLLDWVRAVKDIFALDEKK
jgi:hypothetical protein